MKRKKIDTSDIPETPRKWFKTAKLRFRDRRLKIKGGILPKAVRR